MFRFIFNCSRKLLILLWDSLLPKNENFLKNEKKYFHQIDRYPGFKEIYKYKAVV